MNLDLFFEQHPKLAIAFSGGVDSAYLLYAASKHGCDAHAYFIKSPFQPKFEVEDAKRLANELYVPLTIIEVDILQNLKVAQNDAQRCYYCKTDLFKKLKEQAAKDGFHLLADGTNASDQVTDRPGMQALKELEVCSPLRECGLSKSQIRVLSKEAGLFTHNKPSYACLATRIPTGTQLSRTDLQKVEKAEDMLFALGLEGFRIRLMADDIAHLEVCEKQFEKVLELREELMARLAPLFHKVLLDLRPRTNQ